MKWFKIFLIIFISIISIPVNAENVINFNNASQICAALRKPADGTSPRFKIIVYSPNKSTTMEAPTSGCSNTTFYNNNIDSISSGNTQFVGFNASVSTNKIYIDDTLVKDSKQTNDYSYFSISNASRANPISRLKTLKPNEKVVLTIDVSDKKIKTNKFKDLRLTIKFGASSGDVNLAFINSISYYLKTKDKSYGPFKLDEVNYKNKYIEESTSADNKVTKTKIEVYDLISENLLKNVPANLDITEIKIVPYEYYTARKGSLRIFSISLDGYNSTYTSKNYVSNISDIENVTRHNVVNNIIDTATIKWEIGGNNQLYFYNALTSSPRILPTNTSFYGLLYTNRVNSTINSFISQTTENKKTSDNAYYSYKLATPSDTKVGDKIGNKNLNNTLFVYEQAQDKWMIEKRLEDFNNANIPFVRNDDGHYIFGLDCSSSTFLANGRELPYVETMAESLRYFTSNQVQLLGSLNVSMYGVEKYLREENKLSNNDQMTDTLYKDNYEKYIYNRFGEDSLYNAYGLLIPGDYVVTWGHVRMESGYPYVVCKDGTKFGQVDANGKIKNYYKNNSCKDHKGIDPDKSYIITTEVGTKVIGKKYTKTSTGDYEIKNSSGVLETYLITNHTGWTYNLNNNLTDLTDLNQYYEKTNLTTFRINKKYTFSQLNKRDEKNGTNIYLPFRYKSMTNLSNTKKVEVPTAKLILDKDYINNNQALYDYMAENKKLKGTISTNYIIDGIKIVINGKAYYIYPNQTNRFSLYTDIKDNNIINAIKNLDYKKKNNVTISVLFGPEIKEVRTAAKAESDGYIKIFDSTGLTPTPIIKTTSISVDKTNVVLKGAGDTTTVKATLNPTNATNKNITWSSSNTSVATVTNIGTIKAIKPGTATITVKTNDTGKTATITVTVTQPVTAVKLNKTNTSINVNKSETITATISPSNATNKKVTWKSSDTTIATVNIDGKVTAKKAGKATITATTEDGNFSASVTVTAVVPKVAVTSVSLNKKEITLDVDQTANITATVNPNNATNKSYTWESSDPSIASITNNGEIQAHKKGSVTLTVKTNDGSKTAKCTVTVNEIPTTEIKLDKKVIELEPGEIEKISATVTPSNATNRALTWTSSNDNIATVTDGTINAINSGTVTITAKTIDGTIANNLTVTVTKEEISDIQLEETDDVPPDNIEEVENTPTETKPSSQDQTNPQTPTVTPDDKQTPNNNDNKNEEIIDIPVLDNNENKKDTNPITIIIIVSITAIICGITYKYIISKKIKE